MTISLKVLNEGEKNLHITRTKTFRMLGSLSDDQNPTNQRSKQEQFLGISSEDFSFLRDRVKWVSNFSFTSQKNHPKAERKTRKTVMQSPSILYKSRKQQRPPKQKIKDLQNQWKSSWNIEAPKWGCPRKWSTERALRALGETHWNVNPAFYNRGRHTFS